jgi:hypothetical protein
MPQLIRPGQGFLGCATPGRVPPPPPHGPTELPTVAGTIFFPDVSNYQAGLTIQSGTPALLAKATEGSTFTDGAYAGFRAQAGRVGAVFGAYHFQWDSGAAEAQHIHQVVGSTPLMLDVENPNVQVTLAGVIALVHNYRALGGVVQLAYIPHWYWEGTMGSPSLVPLQQLGVRIVSSYYGTYSDSGPGWAGYGGITPVQWQYTDSFSYGGMAVDYNAFKGTAAQYRALLLTGSTSSTEDDMITFVQEARVAGDPGGTAHGRYAAVWKSEAGFLDWMGPADYRNSQHWAAVNWKNAYDGGNVQVIDPGTLGAFGALRPGTTVPPDDQWSGQPLRGYLPPVTT